jgi:translation initiation factor IF-3
LTIRPPFQKPTKGDGTRINNDITATKIRLIDEAGEMQGVFGIKQAIEKAEALGLDLVEISPNAEPPVCKILDYGKFKYEQQKKLAEAKKKQNCAQVLATMITRSN